jgi:hypothetical protein
MRDQDSINLLSFLCLLWPIFPEQAFAAWQRSAADLEDEFVRLVAGRDHEF